MQSSGQWGKAITADSHQAKAHKKARLQQPGLERGN